VKSIVVSVDYHDLLAITLPKNSQHFEKTLVVTAPHDEKTIRTAEQIPNVEVLKTDAFYQLGATFNKGCAMEIGLRRLGKDGWIVVWDADTLFPDSIDIPDKQIGKLYGARRKVAHNKHWLNFSALEDESFYPDEGEIPGYFQMFHAEDPVLKNRDIWYPVDWKHAGGCDSYFQMPWEPQNKIWADFWVIHYGEPGKTWHGRYTDFLDGTKPPDAEKRMQAQDNLFLQRQAHGITKAERITWDDTSQSKE